MKQLEKITIRLSKEDIRQIDICIKANEFASRSEAIRTAIHTFLEDRMGKILSKIEQIEKIRQLEAKLELIEENEKQILKP